ncbi:hypothetical protein DFH09DRAFT_1368661 [Mycena vulgaris]|nr:hypothetical protein DFH09DRAFT_1368661 [Mycena vulgaris]
MSSSAIPHVIAFLTRPLIAAFAPDAVASAQLILNASLASLPNATFTLTSTTTPPPAIFAASIGAGIPWAAWLNALGGGCDVLLFYGPGYVKVRVGDAQVTDVWSEATQGSVVPISQIKSVPLLQQSTGARLRAMLLSARVRSMRRAQQAGELSSPTSGSDSDADDSASGSDSESDSDCSTTSSKFTAYSTDSLTSAASSPPTTPPKATFTALPTVPTAPALYRAPRPTARAPLPKSTSRAPKPTRAAPAPIDKSKKDLTAYLYQGGVTRVMTGGVMLGPRPAAHVIKFTRS